MTAAHDIFAMIVLIALMLCWLVFVAAFAFRKKAPGAKEVKRERSFIVGIVLQGIAFATVWTLRREVFTPIVPMSLAFEVILAGATITLAILSVWMIVASVRTLGKQWSLAARLVEGHTLITGGPYKLVRHPIYTGMFGMMISTGLVVSSWVALLVAIVVFWIGTMLRTRTEEKLLHERFGKEFDEYARRVPALIPRPF